MPFDKDINGHTQVIFGQGDVLIGAAHREGEKHDEIVIWEKPGQKSEIGTYDKTFDNTKTSEMKNAIRFCFGTSTKSIDVLVATLLTLKEAMQHPEKEQEIMDGIKCDLPKQEA